MSVTIDERTARDRISFLRTLRAVRSFRSDAVPQEVMDDVLEVARWSGSASNKQPWEILIIRERDTLRSLASVGGYAGHLAGMRPGSYWAYQRRRWCEPRSPSATQTKRPADPAPAAGRRVNPSARSS